MQQADSSLGPQQLPGSFPAALPAPPGTALADCSGLPEALLRTLGELDTAQPLHSLELSPEDDLNFDLCSPLDALWAAHTAGADLDMLMPATPFAAGLVSPCAWAGWLGGWDAVLARLAFWRPRRICAPCLYPAHAHLAGVVSL